MIQIMMSRTFPVSVNDAFTYITNLNNWWEYWPNFVKINDSGDVRWGKPGDSVMITIRLLGRDTDLAMTLIDFEQDSLIRYRSCQRGLPDVEHERHFRAVSNGCLYQINVKYKPRRGFAWIFDRLILKRSVSRAVQQTLNNLDTIFRARAGRDSTPAF